MKKLILIPAIFLILAFTVFATYDKQGYNDYYLGSGNWVSALDYQKKTEPCLNPQIHPLVGDLNGDGYNEIVSFCDDTIKIFNYTGYSLDIIDGYTSAIEGWVETAQIFDINGDGAKEIIFTDRNRLAFLSWDNSSITETVLLDIPQSRPKGFLCVDTNRCLFIGTSSDQAAAGITRLYIVPFTSNNIYEITSYDLYTLDGSVSPKGFCFPDTRNIAYKDVDNDGNNEFFFTVLEANAGITADNLWFIQVELNASWNITDYDKFELTGLSIYNTPSGSSCTTAEAGKKFTSPVVYNFDNIPSNGLEAGVGVNTDSESFRIYLYNIFSGSQINKFPELQTGSGQLISNPFRASIFSDSDNNDICVVGYHDSDNRLDLLCGSDTTDELFQTREFYYYGYDFNISAARQNYSNRLTHSIETFGLTFEENDLTFNPQEILNTYGVFRISDYPNDIFGAVTQGELVLNFKSGEGESAVISSDYQKNGKEDLIFLTNTNLWYYDDQFINSPADIIGVSIDPCIEKTIKINSSMEIVVTGSDREEDNYRARVTVYNDNPNIQVSNWSVYVPSLTSLPFSGFILNKTVITSNILIEIQDLGSGQITEREIPFTVGNVGVSYGDGCISNLDFVPTVTPDQTCTDDDDCEKTEVCDLGYCREKTTGDLRDEFIPPDTLPEAYNPLIAFFIIMVATIGVPMSIAASSREMPEGKFLIFLGGAALILSWLFCIIFGFIGAWTLAVAVILAAASLGLYVLLSRGR